MMKIFNSNNNMSLPMILCCLFVIPYQLMGVNFVVHDIDSSTSGTYKDELLGSCDVRVQDDNYFMLLIRKVVQVEDGAKSIIQLNLYSIGNHDNSVKFERTLWKKSNSTSILTIESDRITGDVAILSQSNEVVIVLCKEMSLANLVQVYKFNFDSDHLDGEGYVGEHTFYSPIDTVNVKAFRLDKIRLIEDNQSIEIHAIGRKDDMNKLIFKSDFNAKSWQRYEIEIK